MKRVVFVADDFGMSREVNHAIVEAHRRGALEGAALMMGQPATNHAVALARDHPDLEVGLHLHLADSRPLTAAEWPWDRSPARAGFAMALSADHRTLVRREVRAQWQAFQATGLSCRFVNAHHHLQVHPFVRRLLCQTLPSDFAGWIRWGRPGFFATGGPLRRRLAGWPYRLLYLMLQAPQRRRFPWPTSTTLWGLDRTFRMAPDEVRRVADELGDGLHEFMFHPRQRAGDRDLECLVALAGHHGPAAP